MELSKRPVPLVVVAVFWLTLTCILVILSDIVGVSVSGALLRPNPFAAYELLWPGQSIESVAAFAGQAPQKFSHCFSGGSLSQALDRLAIHQIVAGMDETDTSAVCSYATDDGIFQQMTVTIEGDRVQSLQFTSDSLSEDELLLYWGMPDSIQRLGDNQALDLRWNRDTYWVRAVANPVERDAIVRTITLTINQ